MWLYNNVIVVCLLSLIIFELLSINANFQLIFKKNQIDLDDQTFRIRYQSYDHILIKFIYTTIYLMDIIYCRDYNVSKSIFNA